MVAEKVLRVIVRLLTLIGVLMIGYVLLPFIGFTFGTIIPRTGISIGMVVFVVIAAIFCLTVVRFISSVLALSGLTLDTLAKLMPSLTSERISQFRKTFLNFCFLIFILIAYWVASPLISLVPSIGATLNTAFGIVVVAVVILFFWSIGGTVYMGIETAISKIVVKSKESRLVLGKVREKALKTVVYFLTLIGGDYC